MTCTQTRIANASSTPLTLSLFNGRELAPSEEFLIEGNVFAWLVAKFPGVAGLRAIEKFSEMVNAGTLAIVSSPADSCGQTFDSSSSQFVA